MTTVQADTAATYTFEVDEPVFAMSTGMAHPFEEPVPGEKITILRSLLLQWWDAKCEEWDLDPMDYTLKIAFGKRPPAVPPRYTLPAEPVGQLVGWLRSYAFRPFTVDTAKAPWSSWPEAGGKL